MNIIKPKKLNIGDTIAIIAPSGDCDSNKIINAKKYFENKGYNVKLSLNISKQNNYLAGSDNDRANAINQAFADNDVNAIVCARGGYGALRLVNKIDYDLIRKNPKIFCGYSDITILSTILLKRAGLITFSGPMAQSDFSTDLICSYTENSFFKTLSSNLIEICPKSPKCYGIQKSTEGIIWGGNLSSIVSLCGIDFIPDEKFIFFAEDLNEPVYKIDRYFTQLFNIENFKNNIQAIVLGDFLDIDSSEYFDALFENIAKEYNIPIVSGFAITHNNEKDTVPIGAFARLNGDKLCINNYLA